MITLAALKGFFSSFKVWGVVLCLVLVFFAGRNVGKDACYNETLHSISTYISTQAEQNRKAIERANEDALEREKLRKDNDENLKDLRKASASDTCIPTDDQLRILNEIGKSVASGTGTKDQR